MQRCRAASWNHDFDERELAGAPCAWMLDRLVGSGEPERLALSRSDLSISGISHAHSYMVFRYRKGMAVPYQETGRVQQKARTRNALIAAVRTLLASGVTPT